MKILIETIPHEKQAYDTAGDYRIEPDGTWHIWVSETGNIVFNLAVAIHELWEMALCCLRGIDFDEITDFDKEFERRREKGNDEEPGDSPDAPYNKEHNSATGIERLFISESDENWHKYEKSIPVWVDKKVEAGK